MTTVVHVDVVLPCVDGLTRDEAINTWTFSHAAGDGSNGSAAATAAAIQPILEDFYNLDTTTGTAVGRWLSRDRDRNVDAAEMRWYNISAHLNGSPAGPPVLVQPWTLSAGAVGDPMPDECAIALSFHGADDTIPEFGPGTRPKSRHRGRVFLGPLSTLALSQDTAGLPRPDQDCLDTISAAAFRLLGDAPGPDIEWDVWSRRNAAVYPVVSGWVDDAFDTIRGRGTDPSAKTFWGPLV